MPSLLHGHLGRSCETRKPSRDQRGVRYHGKEKNGGRAHKILCRILRKIVRLFSVKLVDFKERIRFLVPIKLLQIKFPSSFVEKKLSCFLSWKVDDLINSIKVLRTITRGGSSIFFRRGCTLLLLYFNSTPIKQVVFFFFLQNTSCIRKPQVMSGGGGECAHPLHPPPRSAPDHSDRVTLVLHKIDQVY